MHLSEQTHPEAMTPIIGVGVIVRDADGALLIGHRRKTGETPCWCLPGGKIEPGETLENVARRELLEETGLDDVEDLEIFGFVQRLTGAPMLTAGVTCKMSETSSQTARVTEPEIFTEWVWVREDDLPTPLFPASAALFHLLSGTPQPNGWAAYPVQTSTTKG